MKRIVFGITSLDIGGAERVLVDMANELCNDYDVTIFTLYGNGTLLEQLDKRVKTMHIYSSSFNNTSILKRKWLSIQLVNSKFRKRLYDTYIKDNFDVVISFLEGPITWLFSSSENVHKVAWIHSDIKSIFGNSIKVSAKQKMNEELYNLYDTIVFVSKDNLNTFTNYFPSNKVNKKVIYNYLDLDKVIKKGVIGDAKEIDENEISFVQVSRLVEAKAIPRLISVHKRLIDEGYNHKIYIVGNGPLFDDITKIIQENNVCDTFILLGEKENPYPYIRKGKYFILASEYEGYGMVLLEARAFNKFIIVTDCAAREAVMDYDDKMIVENNADGIYEGMKKVITEGVKSNRKIMFNNRNILEEVKKVIEGE